MTQTATSHETFIQNCHECQVTCAQTLSQHCLKEGEDHTGQEHVKAMLDCIAACAACIDFMSRKSDHHAFYCKACAEICRVCADSCEKVGGMDNAPKPAEPVPKPADRWQRSLWPDTDTFSPRASSPAVCLVT